MAEDTLYPRFAEKRLIEALEDSPVVLIQGPRQCGKTTLAQMVSTSENLDGRKLPSSSLSGRPEDYTYFSFDDVVVRAGAEADPLGFVSELPDRVILDEVQRVPALFAALKLEVDRSLRPSRCSVYSSISACLKVVRHFATLAYPVHQPFRFTRGPLIRDRVDDSALSSNGQR